MMFLFTSFKKTKGFKMFGNDWEPIHELNEYHKVLRSEESCLIKKLLHVGNKMSLPKCEDSEAYMLILKDLHKRISEVTKEKEELEELIGRSFDELLERKRFSI